MPAGTPEDEPDTTLTQLVGAGKVIAPVNEQPAPRPQPAVMLYFAIEGTVYSKETKKPLENAEVTLFTAKSDIATVQTNEAGHYRFNLDTAAVYMLHAQKESYMWDERKASTQGLTASATLHQDLYLPILPVTPRLQVLNVYFDFDKADLRPEGADELNNLIKLLQDHPRMKIELRTHTDSRGDDTYNMKLSQKRSEAVVNYLISKGIDKHRLVAKGYGETRLLNNCKNGVECSEEEHQVNRRTEFKILKD
jgi:outer membrane protein OmpA-like peptidoglycan-associated protein